MVAFHAAVVYGLLQHRPVPPPDRRHTVFVTLIAPSESPTPPARKPEPPKPQPPKPEVRKPVPPKPAPPRPPDPPRQLAVEAPAAPSEIVVPRAEPVPAEPPAPSPEPPVEAPPPPARPAGPVALAGDLALACPNRPPPAYPVVSRRAGESGRVVLQVEIDVDGRIAAARIRTGSGFQRLDAAALSAVSRWRCNPPLRDGRPVRAVALQPFQFDLE